MKRTRWVLTTLAFFIVTLGFATDFPKMTVIPVEADKALVAFESNSPTLLEISITNYEGEILYFKRTKKSLNEYQKILDFSELGEGTFNVCLNYGNRSISRGVNFSKKKISVGPPERLYEPYFCMKNGKLNVSFFNMAMKNVRLNIYKDGEHLAGTNLGKDLAIQKCVDFRKLGNGEYEVVLSDCFKDHKFVVQIQG